MLRRVATHLALALGNARLYDNIRRLHLSNLKALSSALSAKDYYTLGHAARVAAYMVLLGKELGWPHETLVQAEEAAYLHDIGKIAISDRVLLKPSRLNSREWELMRQHPSFSADIIGALFAPELVAAVRHHHERYDGGGYPDGLAGDDIPALAQAMCIVDSYDAMSSWRPYRAAMTYTDCLLELERCRGSSSIRAWSTPSAACSPPSPTSTVTPARSPAGRRGGSMSRSTAGSSPPARRRRRDRRRRCRRRRRRCRRRRLPRGRERSA